MAEETKKSSDYDSYSPWKGVTHPTERQAFLIVLTLAERQALDPKTCPPEERAVANCQREALEIMAELFPILSEDYHWNSKA